jgi:VWFA-related protein
MTWPTTLIRVVAAWASAAAVAVAVQEPQAPQFRGGGTTVAVPVTVFDRGGRAITTLREGAFRLFDDGRRQVISNFIRSEQPLTAVLLIDMSASMTAAIEQAQYLIEQFVVRMRPGDRARVGGFSDRLMLSRVFTQDRDALLASLRTDLQIGNPTRLLDAVDNAISALVPETGRRVIVVVTDGCDTASTVGWGRVIDRIRSEEVMVYALQVRTRVNILAENRDRTVWDCVSLEQQYMPAETIDSARKIFQDARHELRPDAVLDRLTSETGGSRFLLQPQDNVNALATQLVEELRQQYLLGFVPYKLDGKFHRLRVEVDGVERKERFVRYRQSYLAAPPRGGGGQTGTRH